MNYDIILKNNWYIIGYFVLEYKHSSLFFCRSECITNKIDLRNFKLVSYNCSSYYFVLNFKLFFLTKNTVFSVVKFLTHFTFCTTDDIECYLRCHILFYFPTLTILPEGRCMDSNFVTRIIFS